MHWKRLLMWSATRMLQGDDADMGAALEGDDIPAAPALRTDLVRLRDFEVKIGLTGADASSLIDPVALSDICSDWMFASYSTKSSGQGSLVANTTTFQSIALERPIYANDNGNRRSLRQLNAAGDAADHRRAQAQVHSTTFTGFTLWQREPSAEPVDAEIVELIQLATLVEDNKLLLLLQAADDATGLGSAVVDVRASALPLNGIAPTAAPVAPNNQNQTDGGADSLEIIIIVAIIVACLAFALLMFAVLWAWRTERNRQDAYKVDGTRGGPGSPSQSKNLRTPDGTGSESDYGSPAKSGSPPSGNQNHARPPKTIQPQEYPESVISEDISTAMAAYYRSGLPSGSMRNRDTNDGASLSSMDSYGYSLDGYAPSLSGGPTQMGYPVGPVNGQIKTPEDDENAAAAESGSDLAGPSGDEDTYAEPSDYGDDLGTDDDTYADMYQNAMPFDSDNDKA